MFWRFSFLLSVNTFSTSCAAVIGTNNMLSSVLLQPSAETVLAATYIGKDIIGQLGGMVYTWKKAKQIDANPIKIAKLAVFLQHSAIYLDYFSISVSSPLVWLGFSSFLKNVAFIHSGAVNVKNLEKINPTETLAVKYTKISSINTLSSTAGMITGLILVNNFPTTAIFFGPILSLISYSTFVKATKIANDL
jgi:hypothetical protein